MIDRDYVIAILAIVAAPIITLIGAWYKAKKLGITRDNAAEILDRAKFRNSLLKRINDLEDEVKLLLHQVKQGMDRERELAEKLDTERGKRARLEDKLEDAQRRINELERKDQERNFSDV